TVTVAKHHTLSIPERVVIVLVKVNCRIEWQSLIVDRVALVDCPVEVVRVSQPIIGLVYGRVACGTCTLSTYNLTWQVSGVLRITGGTLRLTFCGGRSRKLPSNRGHEVMGNTHGTEGMIAPQGLQGLRTLLWCPVLGDRVEYVRW